MNFIKLLPILFLGLPDSGTSKPLEPQLLPSVPGYVPVYIQTGNVPPDVEALYQARKVAELDQTGSESEHKEVKIKDDNMKKEETLEVVKQEEKEPEKPNQEEKTKEDVQQQQQEPQPEVQKEEGETKPPKNNATNSSEEKPSEENKSSESKDDNQKENGRNSGSVIRKVNQYQVNESQDE
ncbi:hypothetical protein O3M35_009709 [Rhynocoris fuscipes]|uniref:Uncharacterized protein n=1 Tax=Rhynocoris fuscipes TaxID=488301 RepID=A0AAW1DAY0_9HEMI